MKRHVLIGATLLATACSGNASVEAPETAATSATEASDEDELVEMPDVVGMTSQEANELLEEAGFEINRRGVTTSDPDRDRTVLSQEPKAGESIEEGGEVSIAIGRHDEPEPVELSSAQARAAFRGTMESKDVRTEAISIIERSVESLDKFAVEDNGDKLVVATTSGYGTQEYIADDAWEVARDLAHFWSDDFWSGDAEKGDDWWPSLDLTVSELHYSCPGDTMRALATRSISRGEWESACGR